jgi:N-acetyltransferase
LVGSRTNHPNARQREKIAGCVIAQPITTAMRIIQTVEESSLGVETGGTERNHPEETLVHQNNSPFRSLTAHASSTENLITVDVSTSLYCSPEPLPTPLGIPRMFVSSSYRRLGIASHLLSAAADNFIHGVTLDPAKGEVAFTQPTSSGKALMEKWAKKGARIYRE